MKILLVTPFVPGPRQPAGAPRAVFDRIALLAGNHQVTVVCAGDDEDGRAAADVRALGVELVVVAARRGSTRLKQARLLGGLMDPGRPMLVQEFASRQLRREVARRCRVDRPDLVLVEHVLAFRFAPSRRTATTVVVSDHDPHLAFPPTAPSRPSSAGPLRVALAAYDARRWRRFGRRTYRNATAVLLATQADADHVAAHVPGVRTLVAPFGLVEKDGADERADGRGDERAARRRGEELLFVGNFDHEPNRDAALWLVRDILPLVQARRPTVKVVLVGRGVTAEIADLAGATVEVTGAVPSVAPYLDRCSVFVAPVRRGGGVRMKVLEAAAAAVPVVTTPRGADGTGALHGEHMLVADTAEEQAAAIVGLLEDPQRALRLGSAGRAGVRDVTTRRAAVERALDQAMRVDGTQP